MPPGNINAFGEMTASNDDRRGIFDISAIRARHSAQELEWASALLLRPFYAYFRLIISSTFFRFLISSVERRETMSLGHRKLKQIMEFLAEQIASPNAVIGNDKS